MNYSKYLISIDTEPQKRKQSLAQLKKVFPVNEIEVISGIDARKFIQFKNDQWAINKSHQIVARAEEFFGLPIDEMVNDEKLKTAADPWLRENPGAVGCTFSHAMAWMNFIYESNDPFALIFEHDIKVLPNSNSDAIVKMMSLMNPDEPEISLVYSWAKKFKALESSSKKDIGNGFSVYRSLNHLFVQEQTEGEMDDLKIYSAAAYIISRPAAQNLLDNLFPMHYTTDWYDVFLERGFIKNLWVVEPALFMLRGELSTTANKEIPKRHKNAVHPLHYAAQACVDYKIPALSWLVNTRRKRLYGPNSGQNVLFV
jgi:GR25 family glycosyltransferase involved in LPS biosynthesis